MKTWLLSTRCLASRWRPKSPLLGLSLLLSVAPTVQAQPQMVDSNLQVQPAVEGLLAPTSMAFLAEDDILVLEKNTGRVQRVQGGVVHSTVLDLAVNFASERGLLGIALHPDFANQPFVYLYWTKSSTGMDTNDLSETDLLGNRVDRYVWDGWTLTWDSNLLLIRAIQEDADQPPRGNHDGGVLRFGPDGKLYVYIGDLGRRGQMQNLPDGPGPAGNQPDDQFGGPEPDDAHLSGVVLRLNDDGSTPTDNPFFVAGAIRGGEAGANLQKVFAYGIRNGFGMAFDPFSGDLWDAQNGDDSFTEINRIPAGANLGWVQVMGPLARLDQFKEIETSEMFFGLQQVRWEPTNIADSPAQALQRMFWVYEGGDVFGAELSGDEEVPAVATSAGAMAEVTLEDGVLNYRLWATGPIQAATQAHIHLGAYGQNGPVSAFLFGFVVGGQDFAAGDLIASGTITESVDFLVERMRQGRAYVNLHTVAHPAGEVRGQLLVIDRDPVSHYVDPQFSWKYEVAPGGLGFINSRALGPQYRGDMVVGGAVPVLEGGPLFRFDLTGNRRKIAIDEPQLADRVADNAFKYDITESESLLFGTGFGAVTDVHTGPNGNLFVVSLTHGTIYEISRRPTGKKK